MTATTARTRPVAEMLRELLAAYEPFAAPGEEWEDGAEGLDRLIERRDESLARAARILPELEREWSAFLDRKDVAPATRTEAMTLRNQLVSLAMEASRQDRRIAQELGRRVEEGRHQAAESTTRSKAASAYLGASR